MFLHGLGSSADDWSQQVPAVAADYPDITATHQYIDALAMFLVRDPGQ